MVKSFFKTSIYIIKRILIGVGIMLLYYFIKGELVLNTYAADLNYQVVFYHSVSGCNVTCNTNTFCNLSYTGSCVNGGIERISLRSRYNILQNGSQYDLFTTLVLGKENQTLNTRSDLYTGNFQGTSWNSASNVTWNSLDNVQLGNNGYYNLTWGVVQSFTSTVSSNGFTFDFYFTSPQRMNYFAINRFDLVNTGSQTTDAINNQTNTIINNQNNNTNQIIENQNQNTQTIVDQIEQSQQEQIESQKVCKNYDSSIGKSKTFISSNGVQTTTTINSLSSSDFIKVYSGSVLSLNTNVSNGSFTCFYTSSKNVISCIPLNSLVANEEIDVPSNAYYIRFSFYNNGPVYRICKTGNQALNDSLTDDSGLSESEIGAFIDLDYASDTPISDLMLMPLTLLGKYVDGFSGTCSSFSLGSLLGTNLSLPCIDPEDYFGSTVWNIIDMSFSLFLIYNVAMLIVHGYSSIVTLDDKFNELYSPGGGK